MILINRILLQHIATVSLISILLITYNTKSQESQIKTIKIYNSNSEISEPIIELNTSETITLSFDDLSDSPISYSYTLLHCTNDWNESRLMKSDYMDGFDINPINDYQNSYSTTIPYTHYKLKIPNNDVKLKISGNYIIKVIDSYNPEKVVLEQKFMVVEPLLTIDATLRQPFSIDKKTTSQQINLVIKTNQTSISNPYSDLIVNVQQNGQILNSYSRLKPVFIRSNEIDYSSPDNLVFDGVNEFRSFNTNSIRYISSGIQNIDHIGSEYGIQLIPSENNRKKLYITVPDINGKNKINLENSNQSEVEADYVWVYFTLPYYDQLEGKEVYVYGALTNWQALPQNQMHYNTQREAFELRLLLKQGYYNYRYVVKDSKTGEFDQTFFEGNHFETENNYQILVYLKQPSTRYERLIGYKTINSAMGN